MPRASLHTPENVRLVRKAQLATAAIAALTCGYLLFTAVVEVNRTWSAEKLLRRHATESARLSRQISSERRLELRLPPPSDGGVDAFAVQLVRWSAERKIRLESLVPEGPPVNAEVVQDGSKLGVWSSSRVRVKGTGDFMQLMTLLDRVREPDLPVQLASFAMRSSQRGAVDFELVFTVFEKKAGAG